MRLRESVCDAGVALGERWHVLVFLSMLPSIEFGLLSSRSFNYVRLRVGCGQAAVESASRASFIRSFFSNSLIFSADPFDLGSGMDGTTNDLLHLLKLFRESSF